MRSPSGKLVVHRTEMKAIEVPVMEVEEMLSPIVTPTNQPKGLPAKASSPEMKAKLPPLAYEFTKEKLLEEMCKAGGIRLTTNQFAVMIAPHVKKSDDPVQHDVWDFALSYIRKLMRDLIKDGLVKEEVDTSSHRISYVYSVIS